MPSALPAPTTAFTARRLSPPPDAPTTSDLDPSLPRPISLQSPADLLHLRATALKVAREKIDLHIPPSDQPDDMRKAVENYVDQFLDNTFRGVREGVEVNGLPGPEAVSWEGDQQEYEEFDAKLASRITALHGRIEKLNLEVANQRREGVAKAAREYREKFAMWDRELAEREEEKIKIVEAAAEELESGKAEIWVDEALKGREEIARHTWQRALEGLKRLNEGNESGLSATKERAGDAVKVVRALDERAT